MHALRWPRCSSDVDAEVDLGYRILLQMNILSLEQLVDIGHAVVLQVSVEIGFLPSVLEVLVNGVARVLVLVLDDPGRNALQVRLRDAVALQILEEAVHLRLLVVFVLAISLVVLVVVVLQLRSLLCFV